MKTLLITLGSILLVIGGIAGFTLKANADKSNETEVIDHEASVEQIENEEKDLAEDETNDSKASEDEDTITETEVDSDVSEIADFEEYEKLTQYVDTDAYDAHVKKDNSNKRIMLFTDSDKYVQFKTIYIKHKDMLKVIDKDKGVLYYGSIDTEQASKNETSKADTKNADEMSVIKNHLDVDQYNVENVKDNQHKSIILFKDDKGKVAYKSIFDKKSQRLKIIDTDGGILFNSQM